MFWLASWKAKLDCLLIPITHDKRSSSAMVLIGIVIVGHAFYRRSRKPE